MGLKDYQSKRKFNKTPEPKPGPESISSGSTEARRSNRLIFVIHKHAARSLHYDLRLEMEGVLKSWAVPRGPSLNPAVKRLAVMVEDHPMEYKDFEGVIPDGQYGAGPVKIWDLGTFALEKRLPDKVLFSETCGRVILTVDPKKQASFEGLMKGCVCREVGRVTREQRILIRDQGRSLIKARLKIFRAAFHRPFGDLV